MNKGRRYKKAVIIGSVVSVFLIGLLLPSPLFQPEVFFHSDWHIVKDTTGMRVNAGAVYEGTVGVFNSKPQGYGVLKDRSGTYTGRWNNGDLVAGKMIDTYLSYEGTFNDAMQFNGFGTVEYSPRYVEEREKAGWADSSIIVKYSGNWENNEMNGLGLATFADSSMVFGNFTHNVFQHQPGERFKTGQSVYGVDLSHFQREVDWNNLALLSNADGKVFMGEPRQPFFLQPVFFAFIKATDGAKIIDSAFFRYMTMARKHGIARGAYHFFRAGEDIGKQAKIFTETAYWLPGDLPPVLDMELEDEITEIGARNYLDKALEWLLTVEQTIGVRPMVYTSNHIFDTYVKPDGRFGEYNFWIARYNTVPPDDSDWTFWQFSGSGRNTGIPGDVDLDLYRKDYRSFRDFIEAQTVTTQDNRSPAKQ